MSLGTKCFTKTQKGLIFDSDFDAGEHQRSMYLF